MSLLPTQSTKLARVHLSFGKASRSYISNSYYISLPGDVIIREVLKRNLWAQEAKIYENNIMTYYCKHLKQ